MADTVHVLPDLDDAFHDTDGDGEGCLCEPRVSVVPRIGERAARVVIHNRVRRRDRI